MCQWTQLARWLPFLEIQPSQESFIDLFEVEGIARANRPVDGVARYSAHLVDHPLGRRRQSGAVARRDPKPENRYSGKVKNEGSVISWQAGSRKLEAGWPLHAVSAWLGHTKLETTAKYLNVTAQYLHELNERVPLTLVKR